MYKTGVNSVKCSDTRERKLRWSGFFMLLPVGRERIKTPITFETQLKITLFSPHDFTSSKLAATHHLCDYKSSKAQDRQNVS